MRKLNLVFLFILLSVIGIRCSFLEETDNFKFFRELLKYNLQKKPTVKKSFTEEEVYQVISNSIDLVKDKYPAELFRYFFFRCILVFLIQ